MIAVGGGAARVAPLVAAAAAAVLSATPLAGAVLAAAPLVAGCGGGEACGNGETDLGEECDDGNSDDTDYCRSCRAWLPPQTVIRWAFNRDDAVGFSGDACIDVHASRVDVELAGATTAMASDGCTSFQVVFSDLPAGTYVARVTPRDADGAAMVAAPVEATVVVPGDGGDVDQTVIVPVDAWLGDYDGTFRFRIHWGGAEVDCGEAAPPVVSQQLTLTRDGVPFEAATGTGIPLDGSAAGACVSLDENQGQSAAALAFGYASFRVVGFDGDGVARYDETFATLIGAGASNPELIFEIDAIAMAPDAGVDAAPDAGVDAAPDAGVDAAPSAPDAGIDAPPVAIDGGVAIPDAG